MEKSNFEILEEIYNNFIPENPDELNNEETLKLFKILELSRRSIIEYVNLQQYAGLFYEHKILLIDREIGKLDDKDEKHLELEDKKRRLNSIRQLIDKTVQSALCSGS